MVYLSILVLTSIIFYSIKIPPKTRIGLFVLFLSIYSIGLNAGLGLDMVSITKGLRHDLVLIDMVWTTTLFKGFTVDL